jgi:hypothetical protein
LQGDQPVILIPANVLSRLRHLLQSNTLQHPARFAAYAPPAMEPSNRLPSSCGYREPASRMKSARSIGGMCLANEWGGAGNRLPRAVYAHERIARSLEMEEHLANAVGKTI